MKNKTPAFDPKPTAREIRSKLIDFLADLGPEGNPEEAPRIPVYRAAAKAMIFHIETALND